MFGKFNFKSNAIN